MSMDKSYNSTAELREDIPNLSIVAEFIQMGNMYVAPNYDFLYTRKTCHPIAMSSPNLDKLDRKIHIGMREIMDPNYNLLEQAIEQIASNEISDTAVLQIANSNHNFVSLNGETDLEINLIESENKNLLLAPAIDEYYQKEAAHDSGASSCLIGLRRFSTTINNNKSQFERQEIQYMRRELDLLD